MESVLVRFTMTNYDSGEMTDLAIALEACMLADEEAQARYLAIYGEPWRSLDQIAMDEIPAHVRTGNTDSGTFVARGK